MVILEPRSQEAKKPRSQEAFTLVEIAIVLVIIGLLVGGVLVGADLIYQSKIRGVFKEVDQFRLAVSAFSLKYNCMPGDCANATYYFGTDPACPSGTSATSGTCDGNGSGQIEFNTSESSSAWKQLGLAGFIKGNYTGVRHGTSVGTDIPVSKHFEQAGFTILYSDYAGLASFGYYLSGTTIKNRFTLGKIISSGYTYGSFMSDTESKNVDQKYDDGIPAIGVMTVLPPSASSPTGSNLGGQCAYIPAVAAASYYNSTGNVYCSWTFTLQ